MDAQNKTRPNSPRAKLDHAIRLAKAGQKSEAAEIFRHIVALQPVNQAAWLWLSAITTNQAEAEAALAQAKKINPAHPSLAGATQWLARRFPNSALTQQTPVVTVTPESPVEERQPLKTPTQRRVIKLNKLAFGVVIVAVLISILVLIIGLMLEVNATALAGEILQSTAQLRQGSDAAQSEANNEYLLAELDLARAERNWAKAISILEPLHFSAAGSQYTREQLSNAYLQRGTVLRSRGYVEDALPYFEKALELVPKKQAAQRELELASAYLKGVQFYQAGQWQDAIPILEMVWAGDKAYINVKDLMYSAYYNLGLALNVSGQQTRAKEAMQAAIAIYPHLSESRRLLAEIEFAMTPETPVDGSFSRVPIEDRLVLVGIAEQRMAVYEGKEQVYDFVVSTGEPGRDTALGEFEIQNKIDNAYASTWNLDMPFWMGIYWAGPLQNGIHSLPVVKHTGQKLWDGYLGQRVSYGCVILGDTDAETLYDWAEVGTKVKIVWSLDDYDWSPEETLEQ